MSKSRILMQKAALTGIDLVEADSTQSFARHTHDQFGIGVILRGAQMSASGRGRVEAGEGDLITVNPGEVHDGMPIGDHGRRWRMAYFDTKVILDIVADIVGDNRDPEFRFPVLRDRASARAFLTLYGALAGHERGREINVEELLFQLIERLVVERKSASAAKIPTSIRHALNLIDDAPAEALTLEDLANAVGLNKFQLLRGFSRHTGLTPHAYLMQKRTDLARRLIRCGTPLAQAAFESGFADQSHMTRMFAGKYGITPGAYAAAFC
jgi:AraC-like DNA-binding protein